MSDNAAKMAWIAGYKRNVVDADTAEKKLLSMIKDEVELMREYHELKRNRDQSKAQMVKRVESLRVVYFDIIDRLHKETLTIEQQGFQQYLEMFEGKLTAFKLTMRDEFDALEDAELAATDDLNVLNSQIEEWTNEQISIREREVEARNEQKRRNEERKQKDVERKGIIGAMDRKIATIGRTGNWDPRDHDAFLRVWNQLVDPTEVQERFAKLGEADSQEALLTASERTALMKRLPLTVPSKKSTDFEEHINWYLQFLHLTLSKKRAIQEWKSELLHEKTKTVEDALVNEVLDQTESINDINVDNHHEGELEDAHPDAVSLNERHAAKERIHKWKADRLKQLEEERLEKVRQHIKDKADKDEDKRKRNLQLRAQLDKWKQTQDDAKLLEQLKADVNRPKTADPRALKESQKRDMELAKNKKVQVDWARNRMHEREATFKGAKVNVLEKEVTRDTNRLLSATKASSAGKISVEDLDAAERRRSTGGAHSSNVAMNARDLQFGGRAIPAWCKPRS